MLPRRQDTGGVQSGIEFRGRQSDTHGDGGAGEERGKRTVSDLKQLEVGLFFWAEPDPVATLANVKSTGVRIGQLAVDGTVKLGLETAAAWRDAIAAAGMTIVTVFAAYAGEDYADIPTVMRTVGFIPAATRATREARTREVIDFAAALGVKSFGCHIGYVPEDHKHPDYIAVRDLVRRIADYAASHGMTFCLETGQEPAPLLLGFFEDVGRANLRINFDPANMILYGSGEPIPAFALLAKHVASVHAKDGDWPAEDKPGALGTERALGQGAVDIPKFLLALKANGYTGTLHVESGVHGEEQRWTGLRGNVEYLNRLKQVHGL
jgi:sugar phosphate isomerase/epimerase